VTGYWPPTNIDTPFGLLRQFSGHPVGSALGERVYQNWRGTGYDVIAIAPTFPTKPWTSGVGPWQVDYQLTSQDIWQLVKHYGPVAVMSFSLIGTSSSNEWLLEKCVTNLAHFSWDTDPSGHYPFVGGASDDPANQPGLPNYTHSPSSGSPPDATRPANHTYSYNAATLNLQSSLIPLLSGTGVNAYQNSICMGDASVNDNYVSAFMGYHSFWITAFSANCRIGFHTHVGGGVSADIGEGAFNIQLQKLIDTLG